MSEPDAPGVSTTIYAAASAAYSACAHTSAAFFDRCASFTSSAFSPDGRAKIASAAAQIPRSIADDPAKFSFAWAAGASVFAAGISMTPRVALMLRLRNADRIRSMIFGCAGVTASGAAATVASLCVMQQPSNFTSTIRASASSQPTSEETLSWIWPALPAAEVALLCGAFSLLTFRASGGRARYLLPSDLCVRALLARAFRRGV
jgi:hypothetical protein